MGTHFFIVFLCFLALKEGHASISPEDYWKSKLPTTHMPQSVKDSLAPFGKGSDSKDMTTKSFASTNAHYVGLLSDAKDSKKNSVANSNSAYVGLLSYAKDSRKNSLASSNAAYVGLLSYAKDSAKNSPADTNAAYVGLLSYAKDSAKNSPTDTNAAYVGLLSYAKDSAKYSHADSNAAYVGLLSYAKDSAKNSHADTNAAYVGLLSYAKDSKKDSSTSTNAAYVGLLSYAKDSKKASPSGTNVGLLSYAKDSSNGSFADKTDNRIEAKETQHQIKGNDNSNTKSTTSALGDQVFFVEENLKTGMKFNLIFKKGTKKGIFLPRVVSNKIPFSSTKLQETYNILSLDPKSTEADTISKRIALCEEPKVEGVEKQCVTSLESMVDFVVGKLGNNLKAISTKVDKDHPKMEYTVQGVKRIAKNDHETIVCHKMGYPYAVFFCHGTTTIRSYMANLIASDGTKIKAVVACHKETNDFLRNYMIDVLKVAPGSTRVCHFPDVEDSIIWVAN